MKRNLFFLFFLTTLFCSRNILTAQTHIADSIRMVIANSKNDTELVFAEFCLMEELYTSHPDTVIPMCTQIISQIDNNLSKANEAEKNSYLDTKAMAYNDLATMYSERGQYDRSIEYNFKSLAIKEHRKNKRGIANSLLNIGYNYQQLGNSDDALDSYLRGLKMQQEINNKNGIAVAMFNIASLYFNKGDSLKARDYDLQVLKLYQELNNKRGIAYTYNNLGTLCSYQYQPKEALGYLQQSLSLQKEMNDKEGIASLYNNICKVYFVQKQYSVALAYSDSGMAMAEKLGYPSILQGNHFMQSKIYEAMGNIKEAFSHYKNYILFRDSITSERQRKASMKKQLQYEFEKKATADSIKTAKADEIKDADIKAITAQDNQKKTLLYAVFGGLFLVIIFSFFLFNRVRITNKQKGIIAMQKNLVEQKNKEMLDSIAYAKNLQDAILPPTSFVKQYFPESFIFFKPKDIVAGDFYWMEVIGNTVFVAAADCTGHGVPGAMVSVVCSNALNRAVKEFAIKEPGKILDKVRELVVETFSASLKATGDGEKIHRDVKDGMDISLLSIQLDSKNSTVAGMWAGANNPLWYFDGKTSKIIEVRGDKQPIGKVDAPSPFTTHQIQFEKNSRIYLFTDGYADQFGGEKGKKFMYKQMEDLILKSSNENLDLQYEIVEKKFEEWKGELEQVDDVLVMGIKI